MSLIDISDPNDPSVRGGLSNPDAIDWNDVLRGGFINLTIDEFTSSADADVLFNLNPPPSFSGPFLVWGEFDPEGDALLLFLATSTGDRTFPFATLDGFRSAVDESGGATNGTGELSRSATLPPSIAWALNP